MTVRPRGLFGPIRHGSPESLGLLREPGNDRRIDQSKHAGWEAWRTPENVVLGLPPGCQRVGLQEHRRPHGITVVCVEPEGVLSVWVKSGHCNLKAPPRPGNRV